MDLLDAQPEFTKAFWDYLDILVTDARIANGREMLAKHRAHLRRGGEGLRRRPLHHRRDLGRRDRTTARMGGDRPVIRSTATLACIGRRQAYFRDEFLVGAGDPALAATCGRSSSRAPGPARSGRRSSCRRRSSASRSISTATAGATSSSSVPDLIASTANNLKKDGWVSGPDLGLRGRGAAGLQLSCSPTARAA